MRRAPEPVVAACCFKLAVSPDSMLTMAKHACENDKTVGLGGGAAIVKRLAYQPSLVARSTRMRRTSRWVGWMGRSVGQQRFFRRPL